jgi:hypothetical protein
MHMVAIFNLSLQIVNLENMPLLAQSYIKNSTNMFFLGIRLILIDPVSLQ